MVACAGQFGTQLGTSQRVRSHGTPSGGLRRSAFVGYDYENRIIEIEDVGDTTVAEFAYDALGRRIKTVSYDSAGSAATYFLLHVLDRMIHWMQMQHAILIVM